MAHAGGIVCEPMILMLFGMLAVVGAVPNSQFHPAPSFMPGAATSPPESEGLQYRAKEPCPTFQGSHSRCGMEWDIWLMVDALLPSNATVMEFGARYGTTSCKLARATANSGHVVSVEPDWRVLPDLLTNLQRHQCNVAVVNGTVTKSAHRFTRERTGTSGYAMRTRATLPGDANRQGAGAGLLGVTLANMDFKALETRIGSFFDTLIIDCEGCIGDIDERLLWQARLIILEEDMPNTVKRNNVRGYAGWHREFRQRGFSKVWLSRDTYTAKVNAQLYSAWLRADAGPARDACAEFARQKAYSQTQLTCLPIRQQTLRTSSRRTGRTM